LQSAKVLFKFPVSQLKGNYLTVVQGKDKLISSEVEIAKIHVFSENCHEKHSAAITNAYAFFLGIFVVLFSFFFENAIPLYAFVFGSLVLLGGTIFERYLVEKAFKRDLKKTSDLIEQVKAGKPLPSLENLLEKTRKS
jgi:hypothetical protein